MGKSQNMHHQITTLKEKKNQHGYFIALDNIMSHFTLNLFSNVSTSQKAQKRVLTVLVLPGKGRLQ
jgi:hypothetical protein